MPLPGSLALCTVLALLLTLALNLALAHPLHAQDAGSTPPPTEEPAAGAAADAASPDAVNAVARELWCPLCSGVRLDACELKACAQMREIIGEKLAAGEDVQSIKNYFVAQYGPQVLGEPPPTEEPAASPEAASPDAVNAVARELWCPLCSGVRLDACELKACAQMKDVIGEKLTAGEDVQSIKNYFVAQYGPQVLGEPPLEGFNWLAWLLPVIVLVGGGLFLWSRARKLVKPTPAVIGGATGGATGIATGGATGATDQPADPYTRQLDEELKHYD